MEMMQSKRKRRVWPGASPRFQHGHQFKAALFALLKDLDLGKLLPTQDAALLSLIRDLVRDTPWWRLLGPHAKSGSQATRRVHQHRAGNRVSVEALTGDIETLRRLLAEADGQEGVAVR